MHTFKKLLDLLTFSEKKNALFLLILILVMAFLDMLGVASIFPFIAVLANPQLVENNTILNYFYQHSKVHFGIDDINQFVFILGLAVFFMLMISLFFRAIMNYAQVRFKLVREYSIGSRLVEGYLNQPYIWFLNRHSADLGKTILSEVSQVIGGILIPIVNLIAQSAVTLALLILLVLVDPVLALSVGLVFSTSYMLIFFLIKKLLSRLGSERIRANRNRFNAIIEAFGAIKELKSLGLESTYVDRFDKSAKIYANNQSFAQAISQLPRYFLEAIALGGMIILVLILISRGDDFVSIVPTITLYAFAGYRLLPSLQGIYNSFTQLRFTKTSLDLLHKDLMNLKQFEKDLQSSERINLTKSIKLKNISFTYPNAKQPSLQDISFEIEAFNKVGIVGVTGSGKTTIVDLILGLLDVNQGFLSVDGLKIDNTNKKNWQKNIGYVPQQIYLSDSSISENIAFGEKSENIDQKKVEQVSKIANLHDDVINELSEKYNTIVGERGIRLSGGQRQRVGIARALYRKPQVLILDEATSALDNLTEKFVMEAINNLDKKITIIIVAHRLSTVKNCNKIILLEKGKLKATGKYEDLDKFSIEFKNLSGSA